MSQPPIKRDGLTRKRKQELMTKALAYTGTLVTEAVNTYAAFENLAGTKEGQ